MLMHETFVFPLGAELSFGNEDIRHKHLLSIERVKTFLGKTILLLS
jgi:hypothetical protein